MKFAIIALVWSFLCVPTSALAYKVYTTLTNGQRAPSSCTLDQPRKLRWNTGEIPYVIEPVPTQVLSNGVATDAIIDSFQEWEAYSECNVPTLKFNGVKQNLAVEYNEIDPESNENTLIWVTSINEWGHSPGILALTTLTYSRCTGIIVDADIEVNLAQFDFSAAQTPPPHMTDIQNTITHEVGHFLGLDHSGVASATMFANAPDAETQKRDLEDDDIAGLCCLYGTGSPSVVKSPEMVCEGAPPQSEDPVMNNDDDSGTGCHTSRNPAPFSWPAVGVTVGLVMLWVAQQTRKAHRSAPKCLLFLSKPHIQPRDNV
ncbi:MAG: matrixin family metalloprotease [Myxococcales bacterium]|nr:matrixin family metalloprotease [Myxococcales bacterium]